MSAKRKTAVVPGGGPARPLTVSKPELLSDNADTVFRRLVHDMLAVSARVQEIRNGLGAHIGLTGSQYTILITIDHNQDRAEGIGVNQVAEHLHLSGAFVTLEVNKLVEKGLVEKTVHPTDRRRVQLCPTDEAQRRLIRLTTLQQPVNNALFGSLSHAEFLTLGELMAKMIISSDHSVNLLRYLTHGNEAPARQRA